MLVGVTVVCVVLLVAASRVKPDLLAVFECFAVLGLGGLVLDYVGRKEAARKPNRLFKHDRLPQGDTKVKPFIVVTTIIGLIVVVSATLKPGSNGSPLPYFIAAGFIFLVVPQVLAIKAVKDARKHRK